MENITPEVVRGYNEFTSKFLCGIKANIFNIRFRKFKVRDMDSGYVLFEVSDDSPDDLSKHRRRWKKLQMSLLSQVQELLGTI